MSPVPIDGGETIASYLAGRLSAAEAEAFERRLSEQPQLRDEVELTLKFKEGLARLQERGELTALLQVPATRRWLPYAAAAALATAALAAVLWLQLRSPSPALLARSLNELVAPQHEPPPLLGTYVLARTRGSATATVVSLPRTVGAIEFRILPPMLSPEARYRTALGRVGGGTLAEIDTGAATPDGYVTIYVDAAQLRPGDYAVSVGSAAGEPNADAERFVIHVQ